MRGAIDFHVHAFPDPLAERAVRQLEGGVRVKARLDGTISSLMASMDRSGFEASVIQSIATKPSQFDSILEWSAAIASPRIIPFASIHPRESDPAVKAARVAAAGLKGVKFHPFYQEFRIDDPALDGLYAALADKGLIALFHAGYDIGYEFSDLADPERILNVARKFPSLRIAAAHLGGWMQWDRVERFLLGTGVYLELSYSLQYLPIPQARKMILAHDPERILFGSDSPWDDQGESLALIDRLELGADLEEGIRSANARTLLGI
jgi:predicted TIM-barrel fold metal-dependent hydrolase